MPLAFERITAELGSHWDSQHASFKPYPVAHVHSSVHRCSAEAARAASASIRAKVREIIVPVAGFIVAIVCEPVAEKRRPNSDSHGRVSMQYTLAEAMHFGELGKDAYQPASLRDPDILRLADAVSYQVDPSFPGPERFKGAVQVVMKDGTAFEAVEEHNRGSAENPMTRDELLGKFERMREGVARSAAAQAAHRCAAMSIWKCARMRACWCELSIAEADSMQGKCALITGSTAGSERPPQHGSPRKAATSC